LQLAAITHLSASQAPLSQSAGATQVCASSHFGQLAPPQSTSVSLPLTIPSAQVGAAHRVVQASESSALASSQVSTSACTKPSPQLALAQVERQASLSSSLPSSQASPGCSLPSPQVAGAQLLPHSSIWM